MHGNDMQSMPKTEDWLGESHAVVKCANCLIPQPKQLTTPLNKLNTLFASIILKLSGGR